MLEHQTLLLEARINVTGGDDVCHTCGRHKERTPGVTETYIAGTELWVCPDCAFGIDSELARFAYDPGSRTKRRQRFQEQEDHWGLCPECGEYPRWKNVGRTHWVYCERHGLKWCVGENLISSWQDEDENDWVQNELFLMRLRETEPYHRGEPTLFERIVGTLRKWRDVIGSRIRPAAFDDEEPPF
jgi:hypothetical protein